MEDTSAEIGAKPLRRPELILGPRVEDEPAPCREVFDPVTGYVHRFSLSQAAVLWLCDGDRTLAALAEHASTPLADVQAAVELLDRHLLLVTDASGRALEHLAKRRRAVAACTHGMHEVVTVAPEAQPVAVGVRDDLRYSCMSCGVCCKNRFRVALGPEDLARLDALDLEGVLGLTLDEVVAHAMVESGTTTPFLRRQEGRCVFHGPDQLCEVHRHFGMAAKPYPCQVFPYVPVVTPDGGGWIRIRPECSSQHLSYRGGELVAAQKDTLWPSLRPPHGEMLKLPGRVAMRPGVEVDYDGGYIEWEVGMVAAVRRHGWRGALLYAARELGPSNAPIRATRSDVHAVMIEVARYEHDVRKRLRQRKTMLSLEGLPPEVAQALERDERALPVMLYTLGLVLGDWNIDREVLRSLGAEVGAGLQELSDDGPCDALLDEYVLNVVSSKYTFFGTSIADGLGLLCVVLLSGRRMAAYASCAYDLPADAALLNECLIFWHSALFGDSQLRAHVLLEVPEALSRLVGLEPSVM